MGTTFSLGRQTDATRHNETGHRRKGAIGTLREVALRVVVLLLIGQRHRTSAVAVVGFRAPQFRRDASEHDWARAILYKLLSKAGAKTKREK